LRKASCADLAFLAGADALRAGAAARLTGGTPGGGTVTRPAVREAPRPPDGGGGGGAAAVLRVVFEARGGNRVVRGVGRARGTAAGVNVTGGSARRGVAAAAAARGGVTLRRRGIHAMETLIVNSGTCIALGMDMWHRRGGAGG
jgi:hypothetical protein